MKKELSKFREEIDHIDKKIIDLISKRGILAKQVGSLKDDGIIYKPEREAQILAALKKYNKGPLKPESIVNIFKAIISNCRALEKKLSISFLGPLGTFSEEATRQHFGDNIDALPTDSIDEIFSHVQSDITHYGVVPVENSTEGAVSRTLDLLLLRDLNICGEISLPVHHCLISKGTGKETIEKIYAHGQSIAQCHDWLTSNMPNVERIAVSSNAEGAKIASTDKKSAAIASSQASELYNLNIISENIEDESNNTTRFLVIAKDMVGKSGNDKTSIVVATKNRPGAIADLVEPFSKNKVSMTKLESRPSKMGLWEYVFFVDIEGHQSDKKVSAALKEVDLNASFMKVLGSYPSS
jgi:chorismate mutase/prephenate dehydratase